MRIKIASSLGEANAMDKLMRVVEICQLELRSDYTQL